MRIHYPSASPEAFKKLMELNTFFTQNIAKDLLALVYLRISQINGCPYCVDAHWKEATKEKVEPRKLNALSVWWDMPFFDVKEKAVLAWAEEVTRLPNQQVSEEKLNALQEFYSDEEIATLTFAISHMNGLNRIAIAFHNLPKP